MPAADSGLCLRGCRETVGVGEPVVKVVVKQTGRESDRDEGGGIEVLWQTRNEGVPFSDNDYSNERPKSNVRGRIELCGLGRTMRPTRTRLRPGRERIAEWELG